MYKLRSVVPEIRRYLTRAGKDVLGEWLATLDAPIRARVALRIDRIGLGNCGDCNALRDGVFELRMDFGPGYRIYYAMAGRECVLLLCGGTKRRQSADISRAIEHLKD